ncbi:hypothetical protein RDMS_07230 [Deinococcus sp. RL]|uniref:McrC family protein n=1 Tax=Deinococcus sp. RL TaxID=1489678 RepID=UPI0004D74D76|nr:hypothetical protein [Deinococcus sp. RL]KEF34433.1 hypothetical protein RDMS_07230 [Deinococcus sp. RL]
MLAPSGGLHFEVREHDLLVRGERPPGAGANVTALPPEVFEAVQAALLDAGHDLNPVALPTRLAGRAALKLTQWVGLLRTPGGAVVEILPKTHERPGERTRPGSLERSRGMLLRMLAATDERFRVAPPAELQVTRMPLYEVVIRYALEGIRAAVRRGVPHAYVPVREERPGLRGRLDLPRQLRQPPHRAHRLHVEYEEFLPDRPETRLTRLAVERLSRLTRVPASARLARELLHVLDGVPLSRDVARDFGAWRLERGHGHFAPLEGLCRMVLHDLNPLVAGTEARANALLFDMNRVYEAYVAGLLRGVLPGWRVQTQVQGRALGHAAGVPAFRLRPDLLLTRPDGTLVIADTKWKRLRPDQAPTYGVRNEDAYQMLAYSAAFHSPGLGGPLWLLYPWLPGVPPRPAPIRLAGGQALFLVPVRLEQEPEEAFPAGLGERLGE